MIVSWSFVRWKWWQSQRCNTLDLLNVSLVKKRNNNKNKKNKKNNDNNNNKNKNKRQIKNNEDLNSKACLGGWGFLRFVLDSLSLSSRTCRCSRRSSTWACWSMRTCKCMSLRGMPWRQRWGHSLDLTRGTVKTLIFKKMEIHKIHHQVPLVKILFFQISH